MNGSKANMHDEEMVRNECSKMVQILPDIIRYSGQYIKEMFFFKVCAYDLWLNLVEIVEVPPR